MEATSYDIKEAIQVENYASHVLFPIVFLLSNVALSQLQLSWLAAHNYQPPEIQRATPPHLLCGLGKLCPQRINHLWWNLPLTRKSLDKLLTTHQRGIIIEREMATLRPYTLNEYVSKACLPKNIFEICWPAVGFSFDQRSLRFRGLRDLRSSS